MPIAIAFLRVIPFADRVHRTAAAPRAAMPSILLARCGHWLCRLNDTASLREMEPQLARDIDAAAGCNCGPEGFAVDPAPFWGIGLTPQPMDMAPPWSSNRRHGH
jgi:hypothetical protein